MWLIQFAMRRPITIMVAIVAIALGCVLALSRIEIDIFPRLNLPVIYVAHAPTGGHGTPAQMKDCSPITTNTHFLYINGIHHSRKPQRARHGVDEIVLPSGHRHGQAMAETIGYVNRARAFYAARAPSVRS